MSECITDIKILDSILENTNCNNYKRALEISYDYIKSVNSHYNTNSIYQLIVKLHQIDTLYPNLKIINIDIPLNKEFNSIIDYIVYQTRIYLLNIMKRKKIDNLNNIDFTNYCKISSEYVEKLCQKYSIKCFTIPIYPAYENEIKVFNGSGFHYINIIIYNNIEYLVDITYLQFFNIWKNNIEKIGLTNIQSLNVGTNILRNIKGKNIVTTLLFNGYIRLTKEVFKIYLDSFTISFRNGLYYEHYNDYRYITDYTIEDYINFLTGSDNQIKHEGLSNLGFQMHSLSKKLNLKNSILL